MCNECEVCGRNKEQIQDELSLDASITEFKGVCMCDKCKSEYRKAHPNMSSNSAIPEEESDQMGGGPISKADKSKDWKERITA